MKRTVMPLVVAVLLAACVLVPTAPAGRGPLVVLAGDSQMYFAEHDAPGDTRHHLSDLLVADGHSVSSALMSGATTYAAKDLVRGRRTTWPATPVISVTDFGVNDFSLVRGSRAVPEATSEANVSAYLDALSASGARCDVLVEVPVTTQRGLNWTGPAWNAFLARQAALRGGTVVPWARLVAQHPTYVSAGDGIHQTPEGRVAFRNAIRLGVRRCTT